MGLRCRMAEPVGGGPPRVRSVPREPRDPAATALFTSSSLLPPSGRYPARLSGAAAGIAAPKPCAARMALFRAKPSGRRSRGTWMSVRAASEQRVPGAHVTISENLRGKPTIWPLVLTFFWHKRPGSHLAWTFSPDECPTSLKISFESASER